MDNSYDIEKNIKIKIKINWISIEFLTTHIEGLITDDFRSVRANALVF